MRKLKLVTLAGVLLMGSAVAFAQTNPAPAGAPAAAAPTAAQQAQAQQLAASALQSAQLVDQGKASALWDSGAEVFKQAVTKANFVKAVDAERKKLGAVVDRKVANIAEVQSQGGAVPAGTYTNVVFETRFANSPNPVHELVSFRLETGNVWRISGYAVQ